MGRSDVWIVAIGSARVSIETRRRCAEYRRARSPDAEWCPDRLRGLLRTQLRGDEIIVVSNREPYIHESTPAGIIVRRPASGLVTAIEPVLRACSGTWIAHGSGSADAQVVDARDRVLAPPGRGEYTLRRVWLSEQEEQGYYYGFANEGLWPLCHVAHVRPVFREKDWQAYREVNQRFADAVVEEARSEDPVVLVQDYHFALLPAMIRTRLPRATILSFWHIPWPNPESFGICPWRREIVQGMLGSTILGFHTRFHCKNFIETVDRYLEARIEHEHSTICFQEQDTLVESYPIPALRPCELSADSFAGRAPRSRCGHRVVPLIVNPYHVEECAAALQRALTMPEAEQRERMVSLRMTVREFNVYRWAGRMLTDAGRLRLRQRIEARVQRHRAA